MVVIKNKLILKRREFYYILPLYRLVVYKGIQGGGVYTSHSNTRVYKLFKRLFDKLFYKLICFDLKFKSNWEKYIWYSIFYFCIIFFVYTVILHYITLYNEIFNFSEDVVTRFYPTYNYTGLSVGFTVEVLLYTKVISYLLYLSISEIGPVTTQTKIKWGRDLLMLPFWFCYTVVLDWMLILIIHSQVIFPWFVLVIFFGIVFYGIINHY